jgi:hypothetical protein
MKTTSQTAKDGIPQQGNQQQYHRTTSKPAHADESAKERD